MQRKSKAPQAMGSMPSGLLPPRARAVRIVSSVLRVSRSWRPPMSDFRIEKDSMGDVQVPAKAYYGAQTQRAVENFPISGWTLRSEMIRAMGLVKWAAGIANRDLKKLTGTGKNPLTETQVDAMLAA